MNHLAEYLDGVRGRLAQATPGPWKITKYDQELRLTWVDSEPRNVHICAVTRTNARLIARAPTDLDRLLCLVKAGQEIVRAAKMLNDEVDDRHKPTSKEMPNGDWVITPFGHAKSVLSDALTRYQAAVQEATRDAHP